MFISFESLAHHLQVCAERYRENANTVIHPRVSQQFDRQALECEALATSLVNQGAAGIRILAEGVETID